MAFGKAIELFLVNGTADSIITAELSNWNGKAIKIPRIEITSCKREDLCEPGVYFLFCKEDDGDDSVYIGEAENVKDRLIQHIRDNQSGKEKYYWNTAVLFTGRDLNKALIRYLEYRLVDIARDKKLGVGLTQQTIAIIPKMAEVDRFLQEHPEYRDRICESHPEVCFARLSKDGAIEIKKSRSEGITKRVEVLKERLKPGALDDIKSLAEKGNCKQDDVLDAVCLAVTARLKAEGKCESIQGRVNPGEEGLRVDNKGFRMQMVVPVVDASELIQ